MARAKAKTIQQLIEGAAIRFVPLASLHLDPENPRLPMSVGGGDKAILNFIASTTAIEDLVNAIATNDFFPGEPLVVVPHDSRADQFTVVEGNRRLTALRLLQNPDIVDEPSVRLKQIVAGAKFKPTNIPVVVRATRTEVLPYLGFRHITGVTEWEPLAKARYMLQLLDELTKKSDKTEARYKQVAQAIGTRSDNVRRNLNALAIYLLLEKADFFGIPDLAENTIKFGMLYTAVADEKISAYVGASKAKSNPNDAPAPTHPIVNPSALVRSAIRDLANWLFNKKDGETVVGDSRNIRKLSLVVSNAAALKALKSGGTLDYAYRITTGVEEDFATLLFEAEAKLREAAGIVANVKFDESILKLASQLGEYVALIRSALESKRDASGRRDGRRE